LQGYVVVNELFSYENLIRLVVWTIAFGVFFSFGAYLFHACQSLEGMQKVLGFIMPVMMVSMVFGIATYMANKDWGL